MLRFLGYDRRMLHQNDYPLNSTVVSLCTVEKLILYDSHEPQQRMWLTFPFSSIL